MNITKNMNIIVRSTFLIPNLLYYAALKVVSRLQKTKLTKLPLRSVSGKKIILYHTGTPLALQSTRHTSSIERTSPIISYSITHESKSALDFAMFPSNKNSTEHPILATAMTRWLNVRCITLTKS